MTQLDQLEAESIYILREAKKSFKRLGMLWSMGKDSTVLLALVRKAFLGSFPFPLIHIDTSFKIPEMITYRDKIAKEWGFPLIIGQNTQALEKGMDHTQGRLTCCESLKTEGLRQTIEKHNIQSLLVGIRRDEEGSRAKERVFSPRGQNFQWGVDNQPPELWNQFATEYEEDVHVRVHPLLSWTEINVWEYIDREKLPILDLYFSKNGKRYRSLGCAPCTGQVSSNATTIPEIIEELKTTKESERSSRAQDQAANYAMEKLRVKGYM